MITVYDSKEIKPAENGSCVTIGNFDGVHIGHQELLKSVRTQAVALGAWSVAVTFDPHPLRVLTGKNTPPFITLTAQKLELIAALKLDACLVLNFTKAMASMDPEEFIYKNLVTGLKMRNLTVGYDYAFGRNRAGNFALLKELGHKYDFQVSRIEPLQLAGDVVSSTRIRDLVMGGAVESVRPLLGRFYTVKGKVERGRNRGGRLLGFPTANLKLVDELFPATGVYAVWAFLEDKPVQAVANIGYNPTFGNDVLSVEVHILDFNGDIYDTDLKVCFVKRLRQEQKFSGIAELCAQISRDIETARSLLTKSENQV